MDHALALALRLVRAFVRSPEAKLLRLEAQAVAWERRAGKNYKKGNRKRANRQRARAANLRREASRISKGL